MYIDQTEQEVFLSAIHDMSRLLSGLNFDDELFPLALSALSFALRETVCVGQYELDMEYLVDKAKSFLNGEGEVVALILYSLLCNETELEIPFFGKIKIQNYSVFPTVDPEKLLN